MNNNQQTLSRILEIVNKGKSGVIIIPPNSTVDAVAASTSLYLGLTKMGKNVSLACSQKPTTDLTAGDKFQNIIGSGGDSLMISFPYTDGSIDKVDYNIQGESFNLVVTPRPGFQKLNPSQVNYSYTGGVVDFIIVVDAPTLNSLGEIYTGNQNQFTGRDIINIDRHLTNAYFGTVNLVNKTISSISELILSVLQSLKIEIDRDVATNLYAGVASATNNFTSYSTNADTFENIATLLRMGAVKKTFKKPAPVMPRVIPPTPRPIKPNFAPSVESQPVTPIEDVEKEKNPQDWLKPKIFKGGGLI
ncbi:MAG: Phosphoesterase RecJ domain protein [Candidatus Roizmanbacteria bacterium GW2011_GWC2_37_13]|uniref:Phosphoesterase RecJ domain protein n=1 Tax=Candidatus Roizmanbacteria bacterium GW2011_GWC2_37_13 TaxID=1618486 RepID=A0A0G0JB37_9BACT|nr:MAG: Phosphoesterase RecJ domain protein [Candidatus Roizmanbacteria bacterium GW2011_GWC1_37_12]KKQ25446.1 MAG: Phosphoesterase RecJ domain protein [Candidatus Roizmanbacteria bacterium GW2011_GWC2_37_13]